MERTQVKAVHGSLQKWKSSSYEQKANTGYDTKLERIGKISRYLSLDKAIHVIVDWQL